jgi:hypothetical protein
MFSILLIVFLFLLNMAGALGIYYLVDDNVREKYLNSVLVKALLLVPPVSIILAFLILFYGILFFIYLALSNYFSNN